MEPDQNWFPIKTPFETNSDGVVVQDKKDKRRFLEARAGDHFMHNFQCDVCVFHNIQKRDPDEAERPEDIYLMTCIRRCNLDALWSKEPTTVENNRRGVLKLAEKAQQLGLTLEQLLPTKQGRRLKDEDFVALAAVMIFRSLDQGKNDKYVQFNTVRQLRSVASNYWRASATEAELSVMMKGATKLTGSSCPTNSAWFENFMIGYHKRVGDISMPDRAISIELMVAMMNRFDERWEIAGGNKETQKEVLFPALFALSAFVGSLRGEEVPLMKIDRTRKQTALGLSYTKQPFVVFSLEGRFKNEIGILTHDLPVVPETNSGLKVQVWVERMLAWYSPGSLGYVFKDKTGDKITCGHYAIEILGLIKDIQQSSLLNEVGIVDPECDVFEEYGMSRSFRRGSNSRATAAGVDEITINLVNRWRQSERAQGKVVSQKMNAHYTDIRLVGHRYLPYSQAL